MIIIYRGIGVLVPIIILITGFVVSIWIKDTRIGNPEFIGWTSFYSAILCLILGFLTFNPGEEKDANGQVRRKKRGHFFFIPIVFWGPILGALSAFLLLSAGKKSDEALAATHEAHTVPVIHFYNPGPDTLDYLIYTKGGLSEQASLGPMESASVEAPDKSYVMGALDQSGEATMTLPYYEEYNAKLYEQVTEDGKAVAQRLIRPLSETPNDYEDNWLLLDGSYDLLLVDVSPLYDGTIRSERVAQINWAKQVKSRYEGTELIELRIAPPVPDGSVYVGSPNAYLPVSISKKQAIYLAVILPHDEEPTTELIRHAVERLVM